MEPIVPFSPVEDIRFLAAQFSNVFNLKDSTVDMEIMMTLLHTDLDLKSTSRDKDFWMLFI